ncbi:uncharacterized protein LOC112163149 isoform X2 [Oryzias melastigma]|uniref:uncharacterized protein LOC112163149 isoform X2 n=1 Tax=Oryzias melastigma TaxID=30732 RepID=UPI000CF83C19|nr:uncharacterized protein LOC112163149 isoform X2 [Oryzias melastigma]
MSKGNHKNDSRNVRSVLQPDLPENNNMKPEPDDHRGTCSAHKDEKRSLMMADGGSEEDRKGSAHNDGSGNALRMSGLYPDGGRTNPSGHASGSAGYPEIQRGMGGEEHPSCWKLDDLKKLSDCEENLGYLKFDRMHAVLVDVGILYNSHRLVPIKGKDAWDSNHVKMPNSVRLCPADMDLLLQRRVEDG